MSEVPLELCLRKIGLAIKHIERRKSNAKGTVKCCYFFFFVTLKPRVE